MCSIQQQLKLIMMITIKWNKNIRIAFAVVVHFLWCWWPIIDGVCISKIWKETFAIFSNLVHHQFLMTLNSFSAFWLSSLNISKITNRLPACTWVVSIVIWNASYDGILLDFFVIYLNIYVLLLVVYSNFFHYFNPKSLEALLFKNFYVPFCFYPYHPPKINK